MHELSIAEVLVIQLQRLADREGARRVTRVVLRIGALSGVEPEALRFAFPVAAEGSCAEGADLILEEAPLKVRCDDCGAETPAEPLAIRCAACGGDRVRITDGSEMILQSAELAFSGGER